MTRILVQRASAGGSSSGSNRSPQVSVPQPSAASRDEEQEKELNQEPGAPEDTAPESGAHEGMIEEGSPESSLGVRVLAGPDAVSEKDKSSSYEMGDPETSIKELEGLQEHSDCSLSGISQIVTGAVYPPPPPPVPPIKPSGSFLGPRRTAPAVKIGPSRRQTNWQVVSTRTSPAESRPPSPKSFAEAEGYNSADEQNTCFVSSYDDMEREHLFELEIKRVKGLEVRRMAQDGNCLFRAVADQVYGDPESYDMVRHMCIDYMEREREHFSQFITEGFTSYCRRKRRDKVYGNNLEIQAFSEMFNRPVHIYSYSTEPINIFHRGYTTDTPPIRLSYHQQNHYNSLVDPRRLTIGAGLGLNSLRGANLDKDQVKAAIQAQQDQQIDNALLAEGRFYSDMELTEKELEQMVIEASRAEFLAGNRCKQQLSSRESSTSAAESSSSGSCPNDSNMVGRSVRVSSDATLSNSVQMVLAMGFSYLQAIEAYSIFGDDVDSMVCYLVEMGGVGGLPGNSRQKGKAAE